MDFERESIVIILKRNSFSDLHATFDDEGMNGFGDFLIVGNDYSESGGPAYAVAIHLTYIDSNKDDEMHIRHFKSIRQDDPKDPAGKFAEALNELKEVVQQSSNQIFRSSAVIEFLTCTIEDIILDWVMSRNCQYNITSKR